VFDREPPPEDTGARYCAVDVTSRASIEAGFSASGAPDLPMVNAGIAEEEDFPDHAAERWERILAINLTALPHHLK
jgi:NAD(P)-dependent dehydrogenase (short-subunit alcohol dehydrogenase family)